jgi:branched-chain amino acid transport system ATP-binding protein
VSAGLLAGALLAYPGGLAAASAAISRTARRFRSKRAAKPEPAPRLEVAEKSGDVALPLVRKAMSPVAGLLGKVSERFPSRGRPKIEVPTEDWFESAGLDGAHSLQNATPELLVDALPEAVSSNGHGSERLSLEEVARSIQRPPRTEIGRPLIEALNVTVQFGGLTAVNDATLRVKEGEITGLIGPNGAGKTTLFNAILGLNDPVAGKILLFGQDASKLPPHLRAQLGVARTFQVLQLFNELSVFDNLLVATHLRNRSGLGSNLAASARTVAAERQARKRVARILDLMGLKGIADEGVRNLPFGTLRMVELARALVTGARVMMLDEPASGLNEAETDRMIEFVRGVRDLGVSILLIEHDIRMVTGVCDYIYVLDQGSLICEGTPAEIRRDPRVIAAYLGEPAEAEAANA